VRWRGRPDAAVGARNVLVGDERDKERMARKHSPLAYGTGAALLALLALPIETGTAHARSPATRHPQP